MTTGRINQVATNQKKWKPPLCSSGNHFDVRNLCVWNFDCVLASVSQLSCTTAPLQRPRSVRNRTKAPPGERALQHQRRGLNHSAIRCKLLVLFGWLKQPLIHTTPKRVQVIQSRKTKHTMKKQKKKSESMIR